MSRTYMLSMHQGKKMQGNRLKTVLLLPSLFIFAVLLMFLASCTAGGLYKSSSKDTKEVNYHSGNEGLRLKFLNGNPPRRLYAGDSLSVVVEYSNKGAYPIQGGLLYLSGYDPEYIKLGGFEGQRQLPITADPKGPFNPDGDLAYTAEATDEAVSIPVNVDIFKQRIKATACYEYKTEASPMICVDPDPMGIRPEDKVCIVKDVSMSSQGAPVAVTSIQQESSPKRIQFKINFANVGRGTVIAPNNEGIATVTKCPNSLERDDVNKVYVAAFLSGKNLKCQPEIARLVNNKGFAWCYYEGELLRNKPNAYQTVLEVELSYGYMDSIATDVDILRMPGDYEMNRPGQIEGY